ncbi:MAG TPA: penicillin-binding protein 2 [Dermatophilaceae bacterium]|nr:penicillin-binding protein 2 [Dermatophilaceae bacterium]
MLVTFTLFGGQLVRLQAFDASTLATAGLKSRLDTVIVPALRGSIVASDGVELAKSIDRVNVTADQQAVREYTKRGVKVGVAGAAADLSPLLGIPVDKLATMLTGDRRFVYLAKDVSPLIWRTINKLGVNGILSEHAPERVYPTGAAASALVGWVAADGRAVRGNGGGLELLYNSRLEGTPGTERYEISRDGRVIPTGEQQVTPAVPGRTVRLTVDSDLQWYAQNAVARKVLDTKAQSGAIVVMEVKTGRLKAVATYPTFDPTDIGRPTSYLQNRAFGEAFEPGSTAKVMTAAAALQEGVATPDTEVTVPNRLPRADKVFQDSHNHPTEHLTFAGVIAQSSNIGTMLVGEKVRRAVLERYFRAFGIGAPTGVGFPGETQGVFAPSADWNDSQRYTVMYGQGLSLNAVQAAGVFQAVANGGLRVPPTLVEGTTSGEGTFTPAPPTTPVRVVSEQTAKTLSQMLEFVVGDEGTAKQAEVAGYRVAGKTGTADRVGAGGRYDGKTASFIGFAPADDPKYVVAVVLQDPVKGYFGGATAGPVFRDVMTYTLQRFGVPPTGTPAPVMRLRVGEAPVSAGSVQKVTTARTSR